MFSLKKVNFKTFNKFVNFLGKHEFCEPKLASLSKIQCASIIHKTCRDPDFQRPAPYPYLEKPVGLGFFDLDQTLKRFDENTKLIVVEGNIGVGKSTVAKQIADAFDMRHFPEATIETMLFSYYGYDYRDLNPRLPREAQFVDLKMFYADPKHPAVCTFQMNTLHQRMRQYIDVLNHILNTGQGAVIERSPFSDFVFPVAMHKAGYLSKEFLAYYMATRPHCIQHFLPPHLTIYLDAPVDTLLKNIKKRNIPMEVNSKVLTESYLTSIDESYKKEYLKEAKESGELLVYDWTEPGDVDFMIEDIERIDFDSYEPEDSQCHEWRKREDDEFLWRAYRNLLTQAVEEVYTGLEREVPFDVPELWVSGQVYSKFRQLQDQIPGEWYEAGFNAECGDTGLLFKLNPNYYREGYHMR